MILVELVVKEQNMLDAFAMIEGYCNLLVERVNLIEQEKNCPEELKEAASSLIYASTRCGEFPELQEIRAICGSRFGREFVARAVELRNNCGVNPKMIQKLSTRMPVLEHRLKVLKEIASENNIVLQLEDVDLETTEEKIKHETPKQNTPTNLEDLKMEYAVEGFMDKKTYKDVADAAQAAFESAAYAAAAARAAVELSRADSRGADDASTPKSQSRKKSEPEESTESKSHIKEEDIQNKKAEIVSEKIHTVENGSDKESRVDDNAIEEFKKAENKAEDLKRSVSTSDSDSGDEILIETDENLNEDLVMKLEKKEIVFDESEDEILEESRGMSPKIQALGSDKNQVLAQNAVLDQENGSNMEKPYSPSHRLFFFRSQDGAKAGKTSENYKPFFTRKFQVLGADRVGMDKKPASVRTRRAFGW